MNLKIVNIDVENLWNDECKSPNIKHVSLIDIR